MTEHLFTVTELAAIETLADDYVECGLDINMPADSIGMAFAASIRDKVQGDHRRGRVCVHHHRGDARPGLERTRRMSAQPDFDGKTYVRALDHSRLTGQKGVVFEVLSNGAWWTLAELEGETGFPQASISARIRDLRKPEFGGYNVPGRRRTTATWEYKLFDVQAHVPRSPST
jgi:hypothetical protein